MASPRLLSCRTAPGSFADDHANLPATRAALHVLEVARCEEVIHVGDAVGSGPHPSEVVSLLTQRGVCCLSWRELASLLLLDETSNRRPAGRGRLML